jgi:hypothetical protein
VGRRPRSSLRENRIDQKGSGDSRRGQKAEEAHVPAESEVLGQPCSSQRPQWGMRPAGLGASCRGTRVRPKWVGVGEKQNGPLGVHTGQAWDREGTLQVSKAQCGKLKAGTESHLQPVGPGQSFHSSADQIKRGLNALAHGGRGRHVGLTRVPEVPPFLLSPDALVSQGGWNMSQAASVLCASSSAGQVRLSSDGAPSSRFEREPKSPKASEPLQAASTAAPALGPGCTLSPG